MGKNSSELWDDSALIDAFDQSVSKYKKMHGKAKGASSSIAEDRNNAEENGSTYLEKTEEESSEPIETNDAVPASMTETDILGDSSENPNVTLHLGESSADRESPMDHMGDTSENKKTDYNSIYSNGTYNQLLSEYYKIENQRQTLLQQLHQASYWSSNQQSLNADPIFQGDPPVSESQYGYQGYYPGHSLPSCSYTHGYHASSTPWNIPLPCSHVHQAPQATRINLSKDKVDGSHTEAVIQAEKVLSSLKLDPSASDLHRDKEMKCETGATCEGLHFSGSSETDLSLVLSAWYTAGFHTGRYLLEQSLKKSQR